MTAHTGARAQVGWGFLALLLALPAVAATNQPPTANAGPDRTATVNVAITLNGSGSTDPDGTIAAYWWQFGDGGSTTTGASSVSHVYTAAGTYSAVLWVRDNLGVWSTTSDSAVVTVSNGTATTTTTSTPPTTVAPASANKPPVANAGPDQATQTLITLTFDGSGSRDPDGTIAMAQWAFGDGATANGLVATHRYAAAGTYTATLTVLDNAGAAGTDSARITVANRPPIANAGPDMTTSPGVAVGLDGSASSDPDGSITGWAWTFGDGASGSGSTPTHAYASAGTYTATLTVTDNNGARATDSATVTVGVTPSKWSQSFGSTGSDAGYAIAGDAAGNTFVAGSYHGSVSFGGTTLTSAGGADCWVAKYAPGGGLVWARSMGGASDDNLDGIAVDHNGDVVVTGQFAGTASFGGSALVANGATDMFVAKYSGANGAHQWSKRFGGAYDDAASAVAVDGANNVYFTGYFRGTVDFGGGPLSVPYGSDLDVFVTKLTSAGAYVWGNHFSNTGNERGYGIAADAAGNVAVTGYFSNTVDFGGGPLTSQNAMTDVFVARFTSTGAHSWSRRFGAPDGNESGYGVALDASGNVVVAGYAVNAVDFGGGVLGALGGADGFVAKYAASNGAHQWSRRIGGLGNDYAYGVAVDGSGNVFLVGSFGGLASFGGVSLPLVGNSDAFVAKYGPTGGFLWAKGLGGIDADVGRGIAVTAGTPVATGYFFSSGLFDGTTLTSRGAADAFVSRLAP